MDKLEEATTLAKQLERACDAEQGIVARLGRMSGCRDTQIAALERSIAKLETERNEQIRLRNTNLAFSKWSIRMTRVTNLRADLTAKLKELAYGLVDEKAFFPSGKKSQLLTDRVTLKSQLPTVPIIANKYAFLSAAANDGVLELVCKRLTVALDGHTAMLWWQKREGKEVGLKMPKPKILNIKVKEKA